MKSGYLRYNDDSEAYLIPEELIKEFDLLIQEMEQCWNHITYECDEKYHDLHDELKEKFKEYLLEEDIYNYKITIEE